MFLSLQEPPGAKQRCVTVDTEAHPQAVCQHWKHPLSSSPLQCIGDPILSDPLQPQQEGHCWLQTPLTLAHSKQCSSNSTSIGLEISMWPFHIVCICLSLHSLLPHFPIPPSPLSSYFPLSLSFSAPLPSSLSLPPFPLSPSLPFPPLSLLSPLPSHLPPLSPSLFSPSLPSPSSPLQPQSATDLGEYDEEIPLENVMQHANLNIVAPVSNLIPRFSLSLGMGSGNETNLFSVTIFVSWATTFW